MATSTIKPHVGRLSVTEYGETITVSASSTYTVTKDVSRSGYRIIGIVGVSSSNANNLIGGFGISGNNAIIVVKNTTTASITENLYFDVLYEAT